MDPQLYPHSHSPHSNVTGSGSTGSLLEREFVLGTGHQYVDTFLKSCATSFLKSLSILCGLSLTSLTKSQIGASLNSLSCSLSDANFSNRR